MSGFFQPKQVVVPGVMGSAAFNDALKTYMAEQEQQPVQPPNAATGFADRYLQSGMQPLKNAARSTPFVDNMLRIGAETALSTNGLFTGTGTLSRLGTLNPEQQTQAAQARADDATKALTAAEKRQAAVEKMNALTDEEREAMGLPVPPGGRQITDGQVALRDQRNERRLELARERVGAAQAALDGTAPKPTQTWWLNSAQTAARSAAQMGLDAAKYPFIVWELGPGRLTNDGAIETTAGRKWLQNAEAKLAEVFPGDAARQKDFITELSAGGASMAGFMLAGILFGPVGAVTFGSASGGSSLFEEAEEFKATDLQKYLTLLMGTGLSATEAIPINRMLMRADAATGGAVRRVIRQSTAGSMEEVIQEVGQNIGEDLAAKYLAGYDPDRELDALTYVRAGLVGGILGGVAGAGAAITMSPPKIPAPDAAVDTGLSPEQDAARATLSDQQVEFENFMRAAEPVAMPDTPAATVAPAVAAPELDSVVSSTLSALGVDPETLPTLQLDPARFDEALAAVGITPDTIADMGVDDDMVSQLVSMLSVDAAEAPRGGTPPALADDGTVELVHYSDKPYDTLDPAARGTGPLRGQERNRLFGPDVVDRTYFGVDPVFEGGSSTGGYRYEGLGPYRHVVKVNPNDLYNWYEDVDGLRDQLDRSTPASEQVTRYERLIKEAGYKGIYFSESPMGQTAMLFEPTQPVTISNDATGQLVAGEPNERGRVPSRKKPTRQPPARPAAFANISDTLLSDDKDPADIFRRPGYAVITAIREDQGAHDSPENLAALRRMEGELNEAGIEHIPVKGAYKGIDQGLSWVVFTGEKRALELAQKYGQESILTRRGLVYSDGRLVPADHDATIVGPEAQDQDFYSALPDGTAFSVGLNFDGDAATDLEAADTGARTAVTDTSRGMGGDGLKFRDFFAAVTEGERQRPEKLVSGEVSYEPVIELDEDAADFQEARSRFMGNFDDHIATSIPGFSEVQAVVGEAIVEAYGDQGAVLLDIGASEGAFAKTISERTEGRVQTVALDPNPSMIATYETLPQAEGSSAVFAAFGTRAEEGSVAWTETDKNGNEFAVPFFTPAQTGYDIVHEAMVFQFVSNARGGQIARVKEMLRHDGVFITEEKFGGPADQYNANEAKKDAYKARYFSADQLAAKRAEVLETGGDAVEGMTDLQVSVDEMTEVLTSQFAHVVQFWSSGNFKGFAASDSKAALDRLMAGMQTTSSEYATEETPSYVTNELEGMEQLTGKDVDDLNRISARFPKQKQSTEDPLAEQLVIDTAAMKASPDSFKHNTGLLRRYLNWPKSDKAQQPDAVAEAFVKRAADNLLWLYNQVDPAVRNRSKRWYDGARLITRRWAERYELPDRAVAGVLAALSPQTDWYNNVNLAERILDITAYHGGKDWDAAMSEVADQFFPTGPLRDLVDRIGGRSLEALAAQGEPLGLQALWVRIFDQAHHAPGVYAVTPEGEFLDRAGATVSWQNLNAIGKALSIIADPRIENVSTQMGLKHKVRSFYNNIMSPASDVDVTVDTHAVAAALLRPLSSNSPEVIHNFGFSLSKDKQPKGWVAAKNVGVSGATGTYGLYADAYRRAAAEAGVLPREMQSIVWEAVRVLYPAAWKRNTLNQERIDAIWTKYREGTISIDQAREEVINVTGGIRKPDWFVEGNSLAQRALAGRGIGVNDRSRDSSYERQLSADRVPLWSSRGVDAGDGSRAASEVAPELEAQTAGGRNAYRAERARPKGGVASSGPVNTDAAAAGLRSIVQNFTDLMRLTVRQGRLTLKGAGIQGQYSPKTSVIRVKSMSDLSTVIHEGGHALHDNMAEALRDFEQRNESRLIAAGMSLYGGDLTNAPKHKKIREGFAEFFRVYVLSRAYADAQLGPLTQDFDLLLQKEAPELREGLDMIREQYDQYLQLPSVEAVQSLLRKNTANSGLNGALSEMKDRGVRTWFAEKVRRMVSESVNRYKSLNVLTARLIDSVENATGQTPEIEASNDPRVLARMARNSGSRAMVQLVDGVMPHRSTVPNTRGLRDAFLLSQGRTADSQLSTIDAQREKDFDTYLVALRSLAEYKRYKAGDLARPPVNVSIGDLTRTVADLDARYGPGFAQAATIVDDFGRALWRKQYDAGLIDRDAFTKGLDKDFYVPLQRDMSDRKSALGDSVLTAGAATSINKRFKGSDRPIISPMQVLMHKTFAVEAAIAENEVKKALAALADKPGTGALVERIPAHQVVGQSYSVSEVARQLTGDPNMTEAEAQDLMSLLAGTYDPGDFIKLFRREQASAKGENIMFYWDNGKLQAIQLIDDDIGADVLRVAESIGRENMPMFTEMIAMTSTAFRASITSWPDFLMVNFMRDQMSAWILTDVGYTPFVTGVKGVVEEVRQIGYARDYNAAMGVMGGMNVAAIHDAKVDRDLNALRNKGYVASLFGGKGLGGFVRGLSKLTELTETGTRVGIYGKAVARAKADGLSDWDASVEAAYTATDYIDFGLNGTRMTLLRRVIPFLNAQAQGLYKMMRTLGGDEAAQRKGLMFALGAYFKNINNLPLNRREKLALKTGRAAWVKMSALSLIGAALTFLFEDDEDYQEAGEYLRTTGWVIPLGEGRLAYIPKPFELAVVNNIVERAIESANGDGAAKGRLLRGVAMSLTPPTSPPLIQAFVEYKANRDFFTGREIVPYYMKSLAPELQYNNYTSDIAKAIAKPLDASPMVVDHFLSSLGASAYRDVVAMTNAMNPDRPAMDATDAPLARRFIRDTRRGSASSSDFWKLASTIDGSMTLAGRTYKEYLERGQTPAAERFLSTLDPDHRAFAILNTHFKAEAKRLNPIYRARQLSSVVSSVRREIASDLGLENTDKLSDGAVRLTAGEKADVDEVLSEIARREVRNSLVYMDVPGWAGKNTMDVQTSVDLLRAVNPAVADEFARRVAKAKIYPQALIEENWPDVRDRLILDGEDALLDDVLGLAKALLPLGTYGDF